MSKDSVAVARRARTSCRAAILLALVVATAASAADDFLTAIAPGVYVHLGQLVDLDAPARGDSANLAVVIGTQAIAVIDTGGAVATGMHLRAAIERLSPLPVRYVINTHVHFDHVLGNAAFATLGAQFVGHRELAAAMLANRDYFADAFAAELGGPARGADVIAPTRLVTDVDTLDLGGRTLTLRAVALAHTATDLTVEDSASGILFAGDLLFRERLPVLDGSLKGWMAWLSAAMQQAHTQVVPGHGPVDRAWPAGAEPERDYFQAVLEQTRAAIAHGALIEDAQQSVAADQRKRWQLTERAHPLNVGRAFRELEWE